jgi:hypothetical protein
MRHSQRFRGQAKAGTTQNNQVPTAHPPVTHETDYKCNKT